MNCNPSALVEAARCYSCIPKGEQRSVQIYLLCRLENGPCVPPVIDWLPPLFAIPGGFHGDFTVTTAPTLDIIVYWGLASGGPYPNTVTLAPNSTGFDVLTVIPPGENVFAIFVARNSLTCFTNSSFENSDIPPAVCQHDVVDNWALRVVANGGSAPSQTTLDALCEFMVGLDAAGLTSQMKAVNCFVPDNLIAAITPLIVGTGFDPWTNMGPFVAADLTINGLKGDAVGKALLTGIVPNVAFPSNTSAGLSVYQHTAPLSANSTIVEVRQGTNLVRIRNANLLDSFTFYTISGLQINGNGVSAGFISGSRVASNDQRLYAASSVFPFSQIGNNASVAGVLISNAISVFCYTTTGPSYGNFSDGRLSFAAIHLALDSSQTQTLFNLVQSMRTSLGGGFV